MRLEQIASDTLSRVPGASYRAALRAIAGFDRRGALAAIAVPTPVLAVAGRTAPPALMQRVASRIGGAASFCTDDAGHIANVEHPAAFNATVVPFPQRHFQAHRGDGPCTSPAMSSNSRRSSVN